MRVEIPGAWLKAINQMAGVRDRIHADHPTSTTLSPNAQSIGLMGEYAFSHITGLGVDWELRGSGDNGVDFKINGTTLDVKTAQKAFNLIVETDKVIAKPSHIYVLAQYYPPGVIEFKGWEFGDTMASRPCRDFGYGKINHFIRADYLQPMESLISRLNLLQRRERQHD